jgi:hypothetical protein
MGARGPQPDHMPTLAGEPRLYAGRSAAARRTIAGHPAFSSSASSDAFDLFYIANFL